MLTKKYRPFTFSEVVGQALPIEVLRSIALSPEDSPRALILSGPFGTGKTTDARIFAKALNCEGFSKKKDLCRSCPTCQQGGEYSAFYQEYDSSYVGRKEKIQEIKEDFFRTSGLVKWRVICLDECHLMSRDAQSSLLTILEDLSANIFVLFCTTDVEKIIDTIRSRCVELSFTLVSQEEIIERLRVICAMEGIEASPSVLETISSHARGHVRDAVMHLDMYSLASDKVGFLRAISSKEEQIIAALLSMKRGVKGDFEACLDLLCKSLLSKLKDDFCLVLARGIKLLAGADIGELYRPAYEVLVKEWGQDLIKLMKFVMNPAMMASFNSDLTVQALFWNLFYIFRGTKQVSQSLYDKARVK